MEKYEISVAIEYFINSKAKTAVIPNFPIVMYIIVYSNKCILILPSIHKDMVESLDGKILKYNLAAYSQKFLRNSPL